eukprot:SAG31_NODE_18365_length_639_cov_0.718519_1_plen_65_part_00
MRANRFRPETAALEDMSWQQIEAKIAARRREVANGGISKGTEANRGSAMAQFTYFQDHRNENPN